MSDQEKISDVGLWLLGILAVLILSIGLLCCVPPVSRDALVHHLAVPKLYLKHGGMYEIPFMPFSYYPMNLELLYRIPLYLGNDIIPKFIHFSFALLTGWLVFLYLRRRAGSSYALCGVILFLSIPVIVKLSITVYVDLGVIFFTTASLLLLLEWRESRFKSRYLVLSGLSCGLALGTKYNSLIAFFLLAMFVPFIYSRYGSVKKGLFSRSIGQCMLFVLVSLLVFSPWMVRNYHWKNNPIYPLYDRWFNPPISSSEGAFSTDILRSHPLDLFNYRSVLYKETWWQIALLPVRIFFEGQDGSHQFFDGKLNPFLLFFPIFAFWRIRGDPDHRKPEKMMLLAFAILFFAFTFFSSEMRVRYLSPMIPPLVLLSVMGLKRLFDLVREVEGRTKRQMGMILTLLSLTAALAYNADYVYGQFKEVAPFGYLTGKIGRDEYISHYRPEYPAFQYINRELPSDALIFFIFIGNRGYYCERNYRFGEDILGRLLKESREPGEIFAGLEEVGATHLLIYLNIFDKWTKMNLKNDKYLNRNEFFQKYTKIDFSKNGFAVLSFVNPSS